MAIGVSSSTASQVALAMAQNPVADVAAVAVVGAVAVGAAVWKAHSAYEHYEEKKHKAEIDKIIALHKQYLDKVSIPGIGTIPGFPAIFKYKKEGDVTSVDSMRYSDDQIQDIGKRMPQGGLYKYNELVLNAINLLKQYYLDRPEGDRDDLVANVLAYLMYVLKDKCLGFEGGYYDIGYLKAIGEFVNGYASQEGVTNTRHFQRLDPVKGFIDEAVEVLERHNHSLSLAEMIDELSHRCVDNSKAMISTLVKLMTPDADWHYVDTMNYEDLAQGILRGEYIHHHVGKLTDHDPVIKVADSDFFKWLQSLLMFFEYTMDAESKATEKKEETSGQKKDFLLPPKEIFFVPDLEIINNPHETNKEKLTKHSESLKSIKRVFEQSDNFITRQYHQAQKKFIPVLEELEIINRTKTVASFATLTHETISLMYFCISLEKVIKRLGDIYVNDPAHFNLTFDVLQALSERISKTVEEGKQYIEGIRASNHHKSQLDVQERLLTDTVKLLDSYQGTIHPLIERARDYRANMAKHYRSPREQQEAAEHEIYNVVERIAHAHGIPINMKQVAPPSVSTHLESSQLVAVNLNQSISVDLPSQPEPTFWQQHKYKLLGALMVGIALLSMVISAGITLISWGALSPLAGIMASAGAKIGIAGAALFFADAAFGFGLGAGVGAVASGTILAGKVIYDRQSSSATIAQTLNAMPKPTPAPTSTPVAEKSDPVLVVVPPVVPMVNQPVKPVENATTGSLSATISPPSTPPSEVETLPEPQQQPVVVVEKPTDVSKSAKKKGPTLAGIIHKMGKTVNKIAHHSHQETTAANH